jgi:protein involved in polysaccharide export with SLBB domain
MVSSWRLFHSMLSETISFKQVIKRRIGVMAYYRITAMTAAMGACFMLFVPCLFAQNVHLPALPSTESDFEGITPEKADYSTLLVASGKNPFREFQGGAIDNSIDETTYIVGGGDVFFIFCADKSNHFFTGTVNQNGDLLIPDLGEIAIGKAALQKAKEVIRDTVQRRTRNVTHISVALRKAKTATVSVTGPVNNPGTYQLAGTQRIWDAIRTACGGYEKFDLKELIKESNLRSIRRKNRDSVDEFDLLAYIYKGDLSQNPYVYPGDEIAVPPVTDRVFVHGEINGPLTGLIPISVHERAVDFLKMFSFNQNSDTARIELRRRVIRENGSEKQEVFLLSQNPGIELVNGDILTVPSRRNITDVLMATVEGEIVRPGMYPIEKNRTLAGDLIAMAGDTTPFANIRNAVIVRRKKFDVAAPLVLIGKASEFGEPLTRVRPELGTALSLMTSTKDFALIRLREHPDIYLEGGDQVIVPRAEKTVYISGNVRSPGGYSFVEGKDKAYYISRAGGYTQKADKTNIYLVAQYGDVRQIFDRNTVEDGEIIVVPMSQEYKKLTTIVLPVLGATLSALGLLVGLFATIK